MADDPEIIEVEDYRIVSVREEPAVDEGEEPPPDYPGRIWTGQIYTGGGGCCLGVSLTLLLIGLVFILGICAVVLLVWRALEWLIP
jgi:hypothetical protein